MQINLLEEEIEHNVKAICLWEDDLITADDMKIKALLRHFQIISTIEEIMASLPRSKGFESRFDNISLDGDSEWTTTKQAVLEGLISVLLLILITTENRTNKLNSLQGQTRC